jgi:threonine/homoserine/homoserine lactone efflux protein
MNFLPDLNTLLTFTLAGLLVSLTPGPDMTLQISRSLKDGPVAALGVIVGTNLGLCVHTTLVALGVSALIVASPMAFLVLKAGGAAYLLWLAFQAIFKGSTFQLDDNAAASRRGSFTSGLLNGLWVNILNPKVIIFFMTFLPQFVKASDPHVTGKLFFLGFYFILIGLPVAFGVVFGAHRLAGWLKANKRVLRALDYTFGGVFSAFAIKILLTQTR